LSFEKWIVGSRRNEDGHASSAQTNNGKVAGQNPAEEVSKFRRTNQTFLKDIANRAAV
jgi:hypothetical protein